MTFSAEQFPSDYAYPPKSFPEAKLSGQNARLYDFARNSGLYPGREALTSSACLERLRELSIDFEPLGEKRGVITPVSVRSALGDVEYYSDASDELIVDCRFALTLHSIGPILRALDVTKLRFSGAYVYRTTRKGRLSLHANGLAIDVHEFVLSNGSRLNVETDFATGLTDAGCASDSPTLNRIACALRRTGVFKELLTPDYNSDHRDHFHLALALKE